MACMLTLTTRSSTPVGDEIRISWEARVDLYNLLGQDGILLDPAWEAAEDSRVLGQIRWEVLEWGIRAGETSYLHLGNSGQILGGWGEWVAWVAWVVSVHLAGRAEAGADLVEEGLAGEVARLEVDSAAVVVGLEEGVDLVAVVAECICEHVLCAQTHHSHGACRVMYLHSSA